ncbi:MAG: DNA alkylation repair enzyme [Rikenellaceae bacterium]
MGSNTLRMAVLLSELKRQMNGAVADGMRYYGDRYGLNYGVSLPTIRTLAKAEGCEHSYARLLSQQQVRELVLCSYWIADAEQIATKDELDFWARSIINSELAQEAAFALFSHVEGVVDWLQSDNQLLQYCALMSLAKGERLDLERYSDRIAQMVGCGTNLVVHGVITLLDTASKYVERHEMVAQIMAKFPDTPVADEIRDELAWRML